MAWFGAFWGKKWYENRRFYAIEVVWDESKKIWLLANYLVILQRFSDYLNAALLLTLCKRK